MAQHDAPPKKHTNALDAAARSARRGDEAVSGETPLWEVGLIFMFSSFGLAAIIVAAAFAVYLTSPSCQKGSEETKS
jgi:hypothetical protein